MADTSTPRHTLAGRPAVKNTSQGPKSSTLSFLRQFARAYHYEPKVEAVAGGLVMN